MTLTKAGAGLGLSIVAARGGAMPRWGYVLESELLVLREIRNFTKPR